MDKGFLQQTARAIIAQIDWKQLSRTTLVLPSHRAGLVLKDELLRLQQEQHAQAIWAPQVQTLPQLQDYLSPLYPEDEMMTVVRLYKHYRRLNSQEQDLMPLDMFYGWGRQMIADFTNVDASMPAAQVPNFFENTIAAHELEQWKLDADTEERLRSLMNGERAVGSGESDSVQARYEVLWKQLYELYTALQAEMRAEQKGYTGMRQRAVIAEWENEALQAKIAGRTYIFVGFNYLLPVERELMQLLRDAGQAQFFWDYVPDFETNEKAFSFAKLNHTILGGTNIQSPVTGNPSPVTLIACASHEAQAQFVHQWLQANYTEKGQKVGVVICDETMLESVIYTLPAITLPGQQTPEPINITKGFPLRNTAVYARVLAWLDTQTRGEAQTVVSPDFIDTMISEIFPVMEENDLSPLATNPSPLTWQELLILESEYQVRKILNQMRQIAVNGLGDVPLTRKLLKLLMRRTMESITMPFHGEPVTDIQAMGVLETRLLDFDKLLILNVEEGVIPQRQSDLSFIPFYLRKAYHMQTPDERATVYAYNFFRLLSRAGHSTLLYATADTSDGGKGMSRFVMQMLYSPEFEVNSCTLVEPSELSPLANMEIRPQSLLSMLQVNEDGVVTRQDGSKFALSPSAMNTYITCKRNFYLQYILGLRPKRDEDVLYDSATLGSFVHHAMCYLYTRYLHCDNEHKVPVTPEQIAALRTDENKKQEALLAAYDEMNTLWAEENGVSADMPHYIPEFHSGENVVILGYMDNILERDEADAAQGLQLYMLEKGNYFAVQVEGVGTVNTGGFIDRLDILGAPGSERLRVIDYKSGSYHDDTHRKKMSATWDELMESEDKGYVRQTFVYSHAVMSKDKTGLPIEPNLYFCSRKLTEIETTIDIEGQTVHDYRQCEKQMTEALQAKIKEILTATDFPCCDETKCPSFCPFFDLCGRKKSEF